MIKVSISQIISDTATLLGEPFAPECDPEDSPFPGLADRVRVLAPLTLTALIGVADPEDFTGGKQVEGKPSIDREGVVKLKLPEDFLRLVSVKMSDWLRPVTHITPPGERGYLNQWSRLKYARGCPERPVAVSETGADGGKVLRMCGSSPDATLEHALYIPRPVISDDSIEIPGEGFYHKLVTSLARAIGSQNVSPSDT